MSTAPTAQKDDLQSDKAVPREPALPLRGDTLLGVCEAIGQDLGINPNWLRVPLAALLLWNPQVIVGCYFGLGIAVLISRMLLPARIRRTAIEPVIAAEPANAPVAADEAVEVKSEERLAA